MFNAHSGTQALASVTLAAALAFSGGTAAAADFTDRDLLIETLTADEIGPLAEAEDELAIADAELQAALAVLAAAEAVRNSAQVSLDTADLVLADANTTASGASADAAAALVEVASLATILVDAEGELSAATTSMTTAEVDLAAAQSILDAIPEGEVPTQEQMDAMAALEATVVAAGTAVTDAKAWVATCSSNLGDGETALAEADAAVVDADAAVGVAESEVGLAEVALGDAQGVVDAEQGVVVGKQSLRDASQELVNMIIEEIDTTGVLVGQLTDKQAFAINRALHSALVRGFIPLDIDTDDLLRILDSGYTSAQIQMLMKAYVHEAQFAKLADKMDAKDMGDKADRFRNKGSQQFDHFTELADRVSKGADNEAAKAAHANAKASAKEAAASAAAESAAEAVLEAAHEAAASSAASVAQEAASELADHPGSDTAKERRGGAHGAAQSNAHK